MNREIKFRAWDGKRMLKAHTINDFVWMACCVGGAGNGGFPGGGGKYLGTTTGGNGKVVIYALRILGLA